MEKYTLIWHPGCSTCKRARAWLEANGIACGLRDIRTDNPTAAELRDISRQSGRPAQKLFNTSGQLYRALGVRDRLPGMTAEEIFALLATDGMLVRRPLLVGAGRALVGFREAEWQEALLQEERA